MSGIDRVWVVQYTQVSNSVYIPNPSLVPDTFDVSFVHQEQFERQWLACPAVSYDIFNMKSKCMKNTYSSYA